MGEVIFIHHLLFDFNLFFFSFFGGSASFSGEDFQILILPASLNALSVITVSGTINIPINPKSLSPK